MTDHNTKATASTETSAPLRLPVWTAGVLVVASLAFAAGVRLTGNGPTAYAAAAAALEDAGSPPRDVRDLTFADRDDRSVEVIDARTHASIATVPAGTNGFLRATLRGLARERLRRGGSASEPFRLSVWDDGRVRLQDLATGRIVALEAFGATNRQAFSDLVKDHRSTP